MGKRWLEWVVHAPADSLNLSAKESLAIRILSNGSVQGMPHKAPLFLLPDL